MFKGTIFVISSETPFSNGHARFTSISLAWKVLWKVFNSNSFLLFAKDKSASYLQRETTIKDNKSSKRKHGYLIYSSLLYEYRVV